MAALAHRFPGALRELDELPMDQIEARLHALERLNERMHAASPHTAAALRSGASAPEWVRLQISYHGCMRAVLRIKRLAGTCDAAALLARLPSEYVPGADEPPLASFDRAALEAILRPAAGA